jgi:hypothetical protein
MISSTAVAINAVLAVSIVTAIVVLLGRAIVLSARERRGLAETPLGRRAAGAVPAPRPGRYRATAPIASTANRSAR